MEFRPALPFLWLLIAQAPSLHARPVRSPAVEEALSSTMLRMRENIGTALDILAAPGLLPNISCMSQNVTELVGPDEQLHAAPRLSLYRCYMQEMPKIVPELQDLMGKTSQLALDMEQLMSGQTVTQQCSLPTFEEDSLNNELFAKCLLQRMDERLSKAKFG